MNHIVDSLHCLYDKLCTIEEPTFKNPSVRVLYNEVADLLSTPLSSEEEKAVISRVPFHSELIFKTATLHLKSEKLVARSFLSGEIDDVFEETWFDKKLPYVLQAQAEQWEKVGVDLKANDNKIAMIGGGALPQSQVYFTNYSGVPVTCIDRDDEVIYLVKRVLEKLKLYDLPVIQSHGDQADYQGFSLVVMAAMVEGKVEVLKRIRETSDAAVCIRNPAGLYQLMREYISVSDVEAAGYKLIDQERQGNSISMVFYPDK
ncbi:MAG: hypothetical protein OIF57_01380 [Marinobacterium sp.]|nr:hypothetical protein [Marinobacterium sp.]